MYNYTVSLKAKGALARSWCKQVTSSSIQDPRISSSVRGAGFSSFSYNVPVYGHLLSVTTLYCITAV